MLGRRVSVDDVVGSRRALKRRGGRLGRVVDMHEAIDALALTDNRDLPFSHLIANIAVAPLPGAGACASNSM